MKLTRWFEKNVKPVRKGVYETFDFRLNERYYNYFDGKKWHYGAMDVDRAESLVPDEHEKDHHFKWRGVRK